MTAENIQVIIVMGVSGCGKTSIGKGLSQALGWPFYDGDDYHPQANIEKMASGIPLDDDDREPWLESLHHLLTEHLANGQPVILASSALKERYRTTLRGSLPGVLFVHLKGSFDLIYGRMQKRKGHYMKPEMLQSQFDALEEPLDALVVDISKPVDVILQNILEHLSK